MPSSVILPKRPVFDAQRQGNVIRNTLTAIAKDIKVDFGVTTQTWSNRPVFIIVSGERFERKITTDSDIYAMLDDGTKAHDIKPRRKRVLRFTGPFRAKTVPNQILSRAGSRGATVIISKNGVRHPGTKPRNWAKTIAVKWRKQAPQIMQRAIAAELR